MVGCEKGCFGLQLGSALCLCVGSRNANSDACSEKRILTTYQTYKTHKLSLDR